MFYDNHDIDEQYQKIRKLFFEAETELYKFLGKTKNNTAAIRARKNFKLISKLMLPLRQSIQKQKQDNKSEY